MAPVMGFQVLLVEPDAGLADEIRRAFGPAGFSVISLQAGEPAVERCRQEPPDLILLAAELPDMSGFSVCNRLKRALSSVPLLLYTAEATDAAIEAHRATRTRADDYLKKPFEIAELLGRAAALLQTEQPAPPPPAEPPAAPRPDGKRTRPHPAVEEVPPVLQRVESGQVAARGLASALAAASAPPGEPRPPRPPSRPPPPPAGIPGAQPAAASKGPPPMPPPVPGQKPQAPLGRVKVRADGKDPFDVLSEWPRDPAPPKGTPEEKLEYFRDRLRARDAFLAKVREAVADMKAYAAEVAGERDVLRKDLEAERNRAAELDHRLQEAAQDAAAQAARIDDARRQLEESENTRQSLSDVLSETMQQNESAEQSWSARIAEVDAERARLEAALAEQGEAHARAVAALEADRADERARAEATRQEQAEAHARELEEARAERERERAEAGGKLALAEERITALGVERDGLVAEAGRLEGELAAKGEAAAAGAREAQAEADALRARIEEVEGRAQAGAGELSDAQARIQALEEELRRAAEARGALEEELRQARAETRAYDEKALAAEHAYQAKAAELTAAEQRVSELSRALEEGRATEEGTRGELEQVDAARAEAERRAAQAGAARDQLSREVESARRETEEAREETRAEHERVARLETEVARLARLEPVAEEAGRLKREVASLRELVQQRSAAAETSARAAQAASSERTRSEERLQAEAGRWQGQAARLEAELAQARRRLEELESDAASREAALRKAAQDAEERRRAQVAETAEAERKHGAEISRLRAAMVDLERHLEARARAELQLKKKVQELERAAQSSQGRPPPAAADPAEVAKLKARLQKLTEDVEDLRGENDFLNGEVARYVQKNKDLTAQLKRS
jgi:DNA-binding response OmpR family regulator